MSYASKPVVCAAAFLLFSSVAVFAQAGGGSGGGASAGSASSGGATGGAAGTNSAGTANSSGGGGGAGAGGAPSPDGRPTTGDAKVDAQDREVDKKVKNICKGC